MVNGQQLEHQNGQRNMNVQAIFLRNKKKKKETVEGAKIKLMEEVIRRQLKYCDIKKMCKLEERVILHFGYINQFICFIEMLTTAELPILGST